MLRCSPWALLPAALASITAAGLWVVYFVAVHAESIAPLGSKYKRRNGSFYPPYISIAGNFPPASCIFSEVMNLAAFLGFVTAVLRFIQLKPWMEKAWLNVGCLLVFSAGCFGMTLVGNFQLFHEEMIHNLGTFMTFGLGVLFCWVQSYITLKVDIEGEGRRTAVVRFLLCGAITVCMICYFSLMAQGLHMQAAQAQWALVMFFLIFLGSFAVEFRHCHFEMVCVDHSGSPESRPGVTRYQPEEL